MTDNASPAGPWRLGLPSSSPKPTQPHHVRIMEVGPRDGLQAEAQLIETADKVRFIAELVGCGLTAIEVASFVSPRRVPQMADATEVVAALPAPSVGNHSANARRVALVPNVRGYERAAATDITEIAIFVSATESFAQANLGMSRDEALAAALEVTALAHADGRAVRGYISMCFGDPWEGAVDPGVVGAVAGALIAGGCDTLSLGDTIGVATAGQVAPVVAASGAAGASLDQLALHFHDTYGQALANVVAGLDAGVSEFDSAAGGLGGCPFARSATGNLATEDLVWLLTGLGYDTGVDLERLARTSAWMAQLLGRPMPSAAARAILN